jgi:hypothetical protein
MKEKRFRKWMQECEQYCLSLSGRPVDELEGFQWRDVYRDGVSVEEAVLGALEIDHLQQLVFGDTVKNMVP